MVNRLAKKAKAFEIRKITRSLKETAEPARRARLEESLLAAKALEHAQLGQVLLARSVHGDAALAERLAAHVPAAGETDALAEKLLRSAALAKQAEALAKELGVFLERLYHANEEPEAPRAPREPKSKRPATDEYFVASLGAQDATASSDEDGEQDDGPAGPRRKNRAGQRARRQVWEQKYGSSAKHVRSEKRERLKAKKAAGRAELPAPVPRQPFAGAAGGVPRPAAGRADTAGLHPSWAAKVQQRQQLAAAGAPSRIVFEE